MWIEYLPWLIAMGVLIGCSGFFSASEAALFFLGPPDRQRLATGNRPQRMAAELLADPDGLLSAILFWNLVTNVLYFTIASIVSFDIQRRPGEAEVAGLFAFGSLMTLIFFSEMLPKTVGVLRPRFLSACVSVPLTGAVRLIGPLMPTLKFANDASRRLIWPRFEAEAYLEVTDLERAVELSTTTDAALLKREKTVLQNIVSLSTIRADELMRPRTRFLSFCPPVSIGDLEGRKPPSGYVLITEQDNEEIAGAVPLSAIASFPPDNLERHAAAVIFVPWCSTVSDTLEQMRMRDCQVAAVINEFGETIGILTFDDILDTIYSQDASRSERLLDQEPIRAAGADRWQVTGMTTVRRLGRYFNVRLPDTYAITVAGVVQEALGRLPEQGDRCTWGPFQLEVRDVPDRGKLLIELTFAEVTEGRP
jgi:CBS domain containing-hemolysin-like protein